MKTLTFSLFFKHKTREEKSLKTPLSVHRNKRKRKKFFRKHKKCEARKLNKKKLFFPREKRKKIKDPE